MSLVSINSLQITATPETTVPNRSNLLYQCTKYTLGAAALTTAAFYLPTVALVSLIAAAFLELARERMLTTIQYCILLSSNTDRIMKYSPSSNFESNTSLKASDGTVLRGGMIQDRNRRSIEKRKIIVLMNGNYNPANESELNRWKEANSEFKHHDVISLNYRGTYSSEGSFNSHSRYVEDGKDLMKAVLAKGYKLSNITTIGYSFGGCIAPKMNAYFNKDIEKEEDGAKLILYHTFHRLDTGASHNLPKGLMKTSLRLFTKVALNMLGWDYHLTPQDWNQIKGPKVVIGGGYDDYNIPPALSAAEHLREKGAEDVIIEPCFHETILLPNSHIPGKKSSVWSRITDYLQCL